MAVTFAPSSAWQDVPHDAVLPPGLEIRMDMATGRNQARLMPERCLADNPGGDRRA